MSKNYPSIGDQLSGQPVDDIAINSLNGIDLAKRPDDYEVIGVDSELTSQFGRLAVDMTVESQGLEQHQVITDESKHVVMHYVTQLRNILDRSGNYDTHPQIPSVIEGLIRHLKSDEQLPESVKDKLIKQTERLVYERPDTIRLQKIKSDLEQAADNIESIISN